MVPVKLHTQVTAQLKVVVKEAQEGSLHQHGRSTDKANSASQSGSGAVGYRLYDYEQRCIVEASEIITGADFLPAAVRNHV